jgi:hypothetical protein
MKIVCMVYRSADISFSAYMLIGYKLIHTVRSAAPRCGLDMCGLA